MAPREDGATRSSYVEDLLAGSFDIMDASKARAAPLRRMGGDGGAREREDDRARAPGRGSTRADAREARETRAEDDLEALFGGATTGRERTTTTATTTRGEREAKDAFGGFDGMFASASTSTRGGEEKATGDRRRAPSAASADFDDIFGGFTDASRAGSQSVPVKASGAATRARDIGGAGAGRRDLFDLMSESSSVSELGSRPESPTSAASAGTQRGLMAHDADDSLIDGLDELLGEVSIASASKAARGGPPEKTASTSSLSRMSSMSRSASLANDIGDLMSSPESDAPAPLGLARFRSTASMDSQSSQPTMASTKKAPDAAVKVQARAEAKDTTASKTSMSTPKPQKSPATMPAASSSTKSSVEDLDDFFSAGATKAGPTPKAPKSFVDPIEAMFAVPDSAVGTSSAVPANGVVDDLFGAMDTRVMSQKSTAASAFEYAPEEEVDPNEPPERAALRKARHDRNRARIETALKEKRARESAARQEQAERQMLKDLIGADIDAWQKKNQNNIRTMLANLGDVLWDGHRYKSPDMGSLMQPVGVKKSYHKALVIIHPDKVSQAGGDMSQRYIADKVFDIIKVAYKEFEAKELK